MIDTKTMAMLLAGASTFAFPAFAQAQAAAGGQNPPASEVVVTGSRVIQNGNNSPTPVTVVTPDALQNVHPTTLIDALNDLPVFSGSRTQQSNPVGSGIAGAGSPASNQLNLRNLGPLRTLILFDGQRVAPTTITNIVDVDIIPQMLIQRVDIVTGGVSAVYGSDAVVGVVNFVPDHNFNGLKLEAQGGVSGYGDNRNWKAGIAVGTRLFDGRGHIEASYEHYNDDGIMSRYSRPWNTKIGVTGTGTAANPYVLNSNQRNNSATFGGLIVSGALNGMTFDTNGVLTPFVHGAATGTPTAEIGGDGYYNDGSMVAPQRFDQFYVRGDYDVTDTIHAHIQGSTDLKWQQQPDGWQTNAKSTISATDPYLPAAYQNQLTAAKQATFTFSQVVSQEQPLLPTITADQYIFNAGLDGKLGKYRWGLDVDWGQTTLRNNFANNQNNQRFAAALDAVVNPATGQIVCNASLTNSAYSDCAPLNPFGPTAASAAALAYIYQPTHFTAHTSEYDFNGNIAGEPFSTWAGPVSTAISGEWRRLGYNSFTDAPGVALANCAGLRFNCTANTLLWASAFGSRSPVSETVWETAFEVEAPLLKDAPFVQSFNLNGAVRYMSYSTKGDYIAWKIGVDWHIDDQFRVRGTASRDIRAPNLNELFAPLTTSPDNAQDLLTLQTPNDISYRQGNPNLVAEIGNTRTIGIVYQPSWLPRFSLSVDLFHIHVDSQIVEVKGDGAAIQNSCYASKGTSPYCTLQTRPLGNYTNTSAANAVSAWYQYNINISSAETYGTDVEINYSGQIFDHRFSLRGFGTWQPHSVYVQPGTDTVDMGGTAYGPTPLIAQPALRLTGTESLELTSRFRVDLVERYRDALRLSGDCCLYVASGKVPPIAYVDLNLSYKVAPSLGQGEMFLNIQNLFNQNPPPSAPPPTGTPGLMGGWSVGDDPIGRAFVVGLRFKH